MTGIVEMFRDLSEPDFYDVSAQLELFAWRRRQVVREAQRRWNRRNAKSISKRRREYFRAYREQQRRTAGIQPRKRVTAEQRREYRRQWMANWRAEQRRAA